MFDPTLLFAFIAAATVLTITPGVDTTMVLRAAATEGPRSAIFAGVGKPAPTQPVPKFRAGDPHPRPSTPSRGRRIRAAFRRDQPIARRPVLLC